MKETIFKLIKDEAEAIEGYDKAIKEFTEKNCDKSVIDRLVEIRNDEVEHIKELTRLHKGE